MTSKVRTQSITYGQIGQINDRLATKLRESGLLSDGVQQVLKIPGNPAIEEMVAVFRKHVEMKSDIIIRRARVDRTRSPMEVIRAVNRREFLSDDAAATMPKGEGDEVDVYFIPIKGYYVPVNEVSAFLAQYGLVPDPRSLAAVNEADPAFADKYPNGTQWGDDYRLTFCSWNTRRNVFCCRDDRGWNSGYLSGVPAPRK